MRGDGGMVLAPPSVKPGVGSYRWLNASPVADAPDWLLALCKKDPGKPPHNNAPARSARVQLGTFHTPDPETPENIARVKSALSAIDPDCDYELWRDICFAVHATGWSCSELLARDWSMGKFK